MKTEVVKRGVKQSRVQPAHWLASFLLYLLVCGATFDVVHKHGNTALASVQAQGVFLARTTGAGYSALPLADACSLCQFQRNLSGTLLSAPCLTPRDLALREASIPFTSTSEDFYQTYNGASAQGRAPPFAILL
jgi:hypothetical protein